MIFGTVDIRNSEGCYLAHSLKTIEGRISKGTKVTAALATRLADQGIESVLVAQLEQGDVHEDDAARTLAQILNGCGVSLSSARTGRVNLFAEFEGLCQFDAQAIVAANAIDEGITVATLAENQWVLQGRMVATVKIIPYAVTQESLDKVLAALSGSPITVSPAKPHSAVLIQTRLPSIKEPVLDKTRRVTENRLLPRAVELLHEQRCEHSVPDLLSVIRQSLERQPDWILIVGASAISDRADVIPEAIIAAGGTIDRYGIPVDPGNLLLLAHIGKTSLIGLPGCARSQRYNGLDMIIDRMACDVAVTNSWLSALSVGGLLTEIATRPAPRIDASRQQIVGIVVLAAGSSSRAGSINKLLANHGDAALVVHVANAARNSQADRVIAVTGYEQARVEQALAPTTIACHYNGAYASGMASSVMTGISTLIDCDAVLICLGDMPHVSVDIINQLIDAYKSNPDKSIFLPVNNNRRGNPVLFSKVFFDTLLTLEGDTGAKKLVQQYPDEVFEVIVESDAVLVDYDTVEELQTLLP